jgi:hypothetical protein
MRSSYHNFGMAVPFAISIDQTWTKIIVRLRTKQSSSHSETASFILHAGTGPTLSYTYLNRPKMDQSEAMKMHQGTCVQVLTHRGGVPRLEGEYYSSRGRANYGDIWMERVGDLGTTSQGGGTTPQSSA